MLFSFFLFLSPPSLWAAAEEEDDNRNRNRSSSSSGGAIAVGVREATREASSAIVEVSEKESASV